MSTNTIEKFQFQNVPSAEDGGLLIDAEIRVVLVAGEPWFVAKDLTGVLGFSNGRDAISKHVLPAQRGVSRIATPFGDQDMTVISEAGLYRLIMRSNVPAAEKFQKWVTEVVLPTRGGVQTLDSPSTRMMRLLSAMTRSTHICS